MSPNIRIWKKMIVSTLLSARLCDPEEGTGAVLQCLKAPRQPLLLPEPIKPVVSRWSETPCLARKPCSKAGSFPAAACGLPLRIRPEDTLSGSVLELALKESANGSLGC